MHKTADNHAMLQEQADVQALADLNNQETASSELLRISGRMRYGGAGQNHHLEQAQSTKPVF